MTSLVCPNEPALLERLEGRTLCVCVDSPDEIVAAAKRAGRRNRLHCVICDCATPIEDIKIEASWRGIPIALRAPSTGRFRALSGKLRALRSLNLRVFLACDRANLVGARLLASLGIPVCVEFGAAPDWNALADLMVYALLGIAPHAPIEPFETMAGCYHRTQRSEDWGRAWFDDPASYLHLDADGRVALSRRALVASDFVADDAGALETAAVREAIAARREAWRTLFADNHFCARCKAWRICAGRFRDGKTQPDGCEAFFCETAEAIERRRDKTKKNERAAPWQP